MVLIYLERTVKTFFKQVTHVHILAKHLHQVVSILAVLLHQSLLENLFEEKLTEQL